MRHSYLLLLLASSTARAAAGDPIVGIPLAEITLTTPQRNCYSNWITSVLPNAQVANLTRLECTTIDTRTDCSITDRRTFTAAQFAAAEAEGRIPANVVIAPADIAADGTTITVTRQSDERTLSVANATSLAACHPSTFGTASLVSFYLRRDAGPVFGAAVERRTVTPAERLLLIRNGTTHWRVGTATN